MLKISPTQDAIDTSDPRAVSWHDLTLACGGATGGPLSPAAMKLNQGHIRPDIPRPGRDRRQDERVKKGTYLDGRGESSHHCLHIWARIPWHTDRSSCRVSTPNTVSI